MKSKFLAKTLSSYKIVAKAHSDWQYTGEGPAVHDDVVLEREVDEDDPNYIAVTMVDPVVIELKDNHIPLAQMKSWPWDKDDKVKGELTVDVSYQEGYEKTFHDPGEENQAEVYKVVLKVNGHEYTLPKSLHRDFAEHLADQLGDALEEYSRDMHESMQSED